MTLLVALVAGLVVGVTVYVLWGVFSFGDSRRQI